VSTCQVRVNLKEQQSDLDSVLANKPQSDTTTFDLRGDITLSSKCPERLPLRN